MKKGIFLFFNIMVSVFIYGQDHKLSESTFNEATQTPNPSNTLVAIIAEKKIDGDFLESTNELERFCIYSHYYLNAVMGRKYTSSVKLQDDARKILIKQVKLTAEEFLLFDNIIKGNKYRRDFLREVHQIDCKINRYLFLNIGNIFVHENGEPIKSLSGIKKEIEIPYQGRFLLEFSDEGLFSKVAGDLDFRNYEVRYFNECGIIDSIKSYRGKNRLSKTEYERTNSRNWEGNKKYYANGSLFSDYKSDGDNYYHSIHFSPSGDTLSLFQRDFTGDFKDFTERSYTKKLSGEITSFDGVGIVNRYSYFHSADSLHVSTNREHSSSVFFKLRDLLEISWEEALQVDSIFSHQFLKNISLSKETCLVNYKTAVRSIFAEKETNLLPFINVSCDMLSDQIVERSKPVNYEFTNEKLVAYSKSLGWKMKSKKAVELKYEYFSLQSDLSKGEWLYYSGLVKFMKGKVDEKTLLAIYMHTLRNIVGVAKSSNYKTNEIYKDDLNQLTQIIDTLGNTFINIKLPLMRQFRSSLNENEMESLSFVYDHYKKVMLDYYERFERDNWTRSYGTEKNRMDYFKLITQWQLKIPNQRLFNQNNRSELPENFEIILEKFDDFLSDDIYKIFEKYESEMFETLKEIDRYKATPYNPYFYANSEQKRKFRRFNWLLN